MALAFFGQDANAQSKALPRNFDYGRVKKNIYTNKYFGLKIHIPEGWAVQNKAQTDYLAAQGKEVVAGGNKEMQQALDAADVTSAFLLTVFKHELGAAVDFNPGFLLVAENTKYFPGIKTGEDYLFHARKLMDQTEMQIAFAPEVMPIQIDGLSFHKMSGTLTPPNTDIAVSQDYVSTVYKNFSLTLIFSYTNDEQKAALYQVLDNIDFK